jgi:hypothetical protein
MKTYKQLQERINMAKAKMGDVIKDFQDSDAPQFKGKSDEKRRQMAIAAKLSNEEVETNEELNGNQHKIDANKNGKVDGHDFKLLRSKKKVEEEVEELDELSRATLASYVGKAAKDFSKRKPKMGYDGQLKKMQNRSVGVGRALDKVYKEEVEELDELSKNTLKSYVNKSSQDAVARGISYGYSKDTKDAQNALKKLPNRVQGIKKATDKLAEEQIEESDGLKPFIVVHAKHGKFETHAGSTYEAAKNAAAHWKTKKGTSGMDVHRADITHSTQHVG